ncbi:ribosome silencing factor [Stigmatella aurantiaca]|uniref:Ribosomal silencing factor RsfS n=1 Tax=Stigmatella aurantiaca (strain DW4/3-1) TaxID=378806 RepID=Q08NZ3_STIAD|nr:ribosome silencing factor [Stigmatella aurantiaca]ADO69659.1 Iojap-like family protein [Stigmatella aurantiaca DW4/3-1]EAU62209.1 iojap domain protein [Stigmatella aurantiaca DW4/3-1]
MAIKKKTPTKAKSGGKAPAARKKTAVKKPAARKKGALPKTIRKKAPFKGADAKADAPAENPRAKALAHKAAKLLADKKATDVLVLDVRGKTSYADYIVLASGESDRQVSAMAENVHLKLKEEDSLRPTGTEGTETGQWVLLDYSEVVVHLFLGEVRAFYDLEGLWADAPREKLT